VIGEQLRGLLDIPLKLSPKEAFDLIIAGKLDAVKNVYVTGSLKLFKAEVKNLPENMHVAGDLDISLTDIKELPKGLRVDGTLYMRGCRINNLPEDLLAESIITSANREFPQKPPGVKGPIWLMNVTTSIVSPLLPNK
jgi:hypothetical protein